MALILTKSGDTITVIDSDLVDNGDKDTSYTLQLLTRQVYREIVERHTTKRPNPKTRAMEEHTDWLAVSDDLVDYVLHDWSGVLDNGQPAPCTRENKLRLDGGRTTAMLDRAGMSQVESVAEVKARSFRATA